MTVTVDELNIRYAKWFRGKRNTELAKRDILLLFSTEPEEGLEWTEQDIYEQCRRIIGYWDSQPDSRIE